MLLNPGQTVELRDAKHRLLGHVELEGIATNLITGTFRPGPEYSTVQQLFRELEAAADSQALAAVERLDATIAALRLSISIPGSDEHLAIHDVQIWSDNGFSCRADQIADPSINGAQGARTHRQAIP
jgi:hypothetical protein